MNETNKSKGKMVPTYIGIVLFLGFMGYLYFAKENKEESLLKNMSFTSGTTYGFPTDGRKQSVYSEFWYTVNGKKYNRMDGNADKVLLSNANHFTGKSFPVVYDNTNPEYSHILIDPADFAKYGIPFPDSLNWVRPYFEKN